MKILNFCSMCHILLISRGLHGHSLLNVIKVLSVITFGPKCNKGLECNICSAPHEITVINM